MSTESQVRQTCLRLYITSKASQVMEDRKKNPRTSRAIIRAMEFTNGVTFRNPRTLMIENCPLGVHIDPARGLVDVLDYVIIGEEGAFCSLRRDGKMPRD
jgi:hypothetical protein